LGLSDRIDRISLALGRLVAWLALLMIAVGAYNALARYFGRFTGLNLSSNAYLELQQYLFSALFLLSAAATLARNGHVRVDVLYTRLSQRARSWIDLAGTLIFLIPFCAFAIAMSWPSVSSSWAILEVSPDPGGLPRYPLKSLVPVAFALLIVQGVSQAIKQVASLRGYGARGRSD
jgi:TRAP-type mannitol/chloroaromatic compound transport system permease small subunit